jgi:ABC-2 type transport system permease protein
MDAPTADKAIKFNRFLPYWAVFQADVYQTMSSWIYRVWVLASVTAAVGYLLYRVGVYREAGIVQQASNLISDLLRWTVLASPTLIVVLTAGCISGERGTLADSILSRGISRYQYYLAKWHARLATVLGTFLFMGLVALGSGHFLLHEDLSLAGSMVALLKVAALLTAVITCGVTVSALSSSTILGITVLWMVLYGTGFALSLLPASYPSPDRALQSLLYTLRGYYDWDEVTRLVTWSSVVSLGVAAVGLAYFSRRDV